MKDSWYSVQAVREKEKAESYSDSVEVFGPDTVPVLKANEFSETIISDSISQITDENTFRENVQQIKTSFDEQLVEKLTIDEINLDEQPSKETEDPDLSKNKESQNIFFTKFRNGSKEKDQSSDDTRLKPKKSLNFFRKNKCASQSTKNDKNKNESVSSN